MLDAAIAPNAGKMEKFTKNSVKHTRAIAHAHFGGGWGGGWVAKTVKGF